MPLGLRVLLESDHGDPLETIVPPWTHHVSINNPEVPDGYLGLLSYLAKQRLVFVTAAVDGVFLGDMNLLVGASYVVPPCGKITYGSYKWSAKVVELGGPRMVITRLPNNVLWPCTNGVIKTVCEKDGSLLTIDVTGIRHAITDVSLWLPGPLCGESSRSQIKDFFHPNRTLASSAASYGISFPYDPAAAFHKGVGGLPRTISKFCLVIENEAHCQALAGNLNDLSKRRPMRTLVVVYNNQREVDVGIEAGEPNSGFIKKLSWRNIADDFCYRAVTALAHINAKMTSILLGGQKRYIVRVMREVLRLSSLHSMCLHLEDVHRPIPVLNMLRNRSFQLTEIDLHVTRMDDPAFFRELLADQAPSLEVVKLSENNPDDQHICDFCCPHMIIPNGMSRLRKVELTNLTCMARAVAGVIAQNVPIDLTVNVRQLDEFGLRQFVVLNGPKPPPCSISDVTLNSGLYAPNLYIHARMWRNLQKVNVTHVTLDNIRDVLEFAQFATDICMQIDCHDFDPTAQDKSPTGVDNIIADAYFVGGDPHFTVSLAQCYNLRSLELTFVVPDESVCAWPAVGLRLYLEGIALLDYLDDFKCNAISSPLQRRLRARARANRTFHFDCTRRHTSVRLED